MQGLGHHELDLVSFLGMGDGTTEGESSDCGNIAEADAVNGPGCWG